MTVGKHVMLLYGNKKLSQAALGGAIRTSGDIIGRHERGIITPSIEVIMKITHTFNVSIGFLVSKTNLEPDRQTIERLEDISTLSKESKNFVLKMIDLAIQNFKTKTAFAAK